MSSSQSPVVRLIGLVFVALLLGGGEALATADPRLTLDGNPVILGAENTANGTTRITAQEVALYGISSTDDGALVGESVALDGYGVRGTSPHIGVNAVGGEIGVYAVSDYGAGVEALTYDGIAVHASTAVDAGTALRVDGRAEFRWSGRVTIPAGANHVTVENVSLTGESLVLANLQEHVHGTRIDAAVPDADARSFTLHLNRRLRHPVSAAWFVID